MTLLSPRTLILYASLFVFNEFAFCENANVTVVTVGGPPSSSSSRAAVIASLSNTTLLSNVTHHCAHSSCEQPDRDALVTGTVDNNTVAKSGRKSRNLNVTTASTSTTASARPKPAGTKAPQRPSNVTRPSKSGGGLKSPQKPRITTTWPKPDKRLSDGVRKPHPPAAAAAAASTTISVNQTDESVVVADFKARYPVDMWKEHGFYTDDYMHLINGHWFKFAPPNAMSHYILGSLYTVIMVFGCFGNFLVIFMYIKCKSLQTPANVLIMNLAVSDFIMLAKTPVFIYNSYYQGPTLGKLGCQVYGFFGGLTGTVSIMTLAAIALDRYYVIVDPLNAAVKTTKQRARAWLALIWLYGFSFSVIPVLDLGYNRYVPEGYLTSCSFDYLTDDGHEKGFILVFFAAAWCVPFTTISYCYVKILRAVWATGEMAASSRFGQEEEKRKTEIRLGYVVVGVIVVWFLSWTPYAVVALLGVFGHHTYITPLSSMIPALFCKAASCMDPWIYAITHPRFKNELTKLLSRKKTRKLERDYGVKNKGWGGHSHTSAKSGGCDRNQSSTEDDDVDEVIVMVDPDNNKIHRQGSTSSHKTVETRALETKFPPTRQESLKYLPPSWYKMPRTSSKSSIKINAKPAGDSNIK